MYDSTANSVEEVRKMISTAVSYWRISLATVMPFSAGMMTSRNRISYRTPFSISAIRSSGLRNAVHWIWMQR